MNILNVVLSFYLGTLALLSLQAFAYLDPGNGSLLLQIILGGAAGVGVFFRYYGRRLFDKLTFKKKISKEEG